ncbi:MAG: fatty acid--CoA ligase [Pseudomonadota bacterium]
MANADYELLADVPAYNAEQFADRIAFEFEGRQLTYGALQTHTNQCAQALLSIGTEPDERVAYLGKNCPEYWEILLGCAKAGAVMTPINWRLALPEITYILNDAGIRTLFLGKDFAHLEGDLRREETKLKTIIPVEHSSVAHVSYETWRDTSPALPPTVTRVASDDLLQLYTSGTTGRPKGAVISNSAYLEASRRQKDPDGPKWNSWSASDVSLVAMPCFHIGGTGWGLTGLINGALGVIMREFDPNSVLDFIDRFKVSKLFLVPAAMQIVVNQPAARSTDFSQLDYILYGASPIPLDLLRQAMDVFGCGFVQMYGMTETAGTIVALPPEDHDPNGTPRMRAAGKPLKGVEICILDADGNTLAPGEVGEIAIKSPSNMSKYWQLPGPTAETLQNGWLRSGDAGYLDEDGYVYIHDRVKDMIISGGENIYPAEVENAIFSHERVADVAVIGVPDEKWGEAVKAAVIAKPGSVLSEAEIIAWARERIAKYKCPKSVDFVDEIPRNASGKILRKDLRALYWKDYGRQVN